ncbi:MAG: class 1 fructose-bisphosphatase [Cytophagales bacterium]|jgi:fructose-1,6-bisphosphatase I|nr:class 1 fructose-bisphosphatase [Cytophagales bacterium]MCE2894024.1 class 1 fructose-bisphosphatase [Flammeovirgaceae bacterium]NOS56467.1 class 1 fructose-bisphosphatase [Cyclobacteriaceae bacterium]MCA6378739.1 class 1 fructose-bisphosphatase [Cytophagales bacterium]MCA6387782.1 class 1 fructose-bisphosphatase [Cytophagales bacterium]
MEASRIALPIGTALDRFIKNNQFQFQYASGELSQLLRDIALASKVVNREINKAGLIDIMGSMGSQNSTGEQQQKLDVLANIRFTRALTKGGEVCALISEETESFVDLSNDGKYVIAIDPLDGSSNIDVNVSIGTIFSIYRRKSEVGLPISDADILQTGDEQVAAGYILYGSSTMLVYTTGHGVNGFTYEPTLGEYVLSHPDMTIPETGKIYSINEGSANSFSQSVKSYIQYCKDNNYTARYIGSLVADFHRNLLKGGIYVYPATAKDVNGKLRLMYECNALAFIAEQAGGKATDGKGRIMEIKPKDLHQRTPFYVGSKRMVEKAIEGI